MSELEKWNKFLNDNYSKIKAHMRQMMYFQTFGDYNDDDIHEALTLIGEAVSRGYKIRYENDEVWNLIFITYKNICLKNIEQVQRNGGEYNDSILYDDSEQEYTEMDTSIVEDMIKDIQENFPPKYYDAVKDFMAGKLDNCKDRGKWMEVRNYLRYRYGKEQPKVRKKAQRQESKRLYQYDRYGNLIAEYNSVFDCCQKTGLCPVLIKNYLKGKIDFAYSYHWTRKKKN